MSLRDQLNEDLKTAMRAREMTRVGVFRLIFAEIKQKEVDTRKTMEEPEILSVLEKMIKQRKDSINQFTQAARHDLVAVEEAELSMIQSYLPTPYSEAEIEALIQSAILKVQAEKPQALGPAMMGSVIALIRPTLAGRADMGAVSGLVKKALTPR